MMRIPNLGYRLLQKLLGRLRRSQMDASDFTSQLAQARLDWPGWLARRRAAPRQSIDCALPHAAVLAERCPSAAQAAIRAADQALAHRFDLLGSGPFVPVDPERPARADGYQPIDWYLDPLRGLRFPRGIPHRDWRLYEMRPENADIKYPWELARCQHFPALGQAWRITGDARYARELADQIDDFMDANPVGIGVNWTCTMDVAIRAANWCMGLSLIGDCPALAAAFPERAWRALFDHGRFIFGNLENTYEVTSNHYLSNVVGLFFLAAEFSDLPGGRQWEAFCRTALEREIEVQVLPDGADFESSIPYHRLVTELFLGSARLAQVQGRPLSDNYQRRLRVMIEYHLGVLCPDGLMPVLGDADDGRLHILTDAADWVRGDGRHLLAPAALVLGEPAWLDHAGPDGLWEAGWWGFDPAAIVTGSAPLPDSVRLFPESGVFVARTGGHYLMVSNGRVGTKGIGNHKHNDLLSFEFHDGGVPLVVDPGSYVYTSDFDTRNRFRSTASHSTLRVDGVEQNDLRPDMLFRMFEVADPEHREHGTEGGAVVYAGHHRGYARLDPPVAEHRRRFRLDPASGVLDIDDSLHGTGEHRLDWHFHLAPGVSARLYSPGEIRLNAANRGWILQFPADLAVVLGDGWYSPSYALRVPTQVIDLSLTTRIDGTARWSFRIMPASDAGPDASGEPPC